VLLKALALHISEPAILTLLQRMLARLDDVNGELLLATLLSKKRISKGPWRSAKSPGINQALSLD